MASRGGSKDGGSRVSMGGDGGTINLFVKWAGDPAFVEIDLKRDWTVARALKAIKLKLPSLHDVGALEVRLDERGVVGTPLDRTLTLDKAKLGNKDRLVVGVLDAAGDAVASGV